MKVDISINGDSVDALSFVCHRDSAQHRGRDVAKRLKDVIDRQQFEVVVHAKMGVRPFAKERIPPYRYVRISNVYITPSMIIYVL